MTSNHDDDQFDDLEMFDEVSDEAYDVPVNPAEGEGGAEDSYEEDWDSFDEPAEAAEDEATEPAAPQKQKKPSNFNKIVIGAGVLVGAVVLVMQLGGGNNNAAPSMQPANDVVQAQPSPGTPSGAGNQQANNDPASGGFLNNPDGMAALERDVVTSYNDTEIIPYDQRPAEVDNAPAPPMPTAMTPDMAPPQAMAAPQATENTLRMPNAQEALLKRPSPPPVDTQLATDLVAPQPAAAAVPVPAVETRIPSPVQDTLPERIEPPVVAAIPQAVVQPPANAQPSAELVVKMDQILSRLDGLEGEIKTLKTASRTDTPSGGVTPAQLDSQLNDVKKALTALERKIDARPAVAAAAPAPRKPDPTPAAATPKAQILGSSAPAVRAPKPAVQAAPAPVAVPATPRWVLKGAQPGRAMVAQSGNNDLRTVEVGDNLPGLGRITAILYQNGRWQVQATQGQLNQ